jgi:hypothetical protein
MNENDGLEHSLGHAHHIGHELVEIGALVGHDLRRRDG